MNNSKQPGGGKLTPLVATLNLRGQTKMNMIKQLQIDELVKAQKAAIIFFQESHILDQTFENCPHIKANFQLLINNSENGYGTSALIHNSLKIENVKALPGGRILYFEINRISFCNVYLPSGTAGKAEREAILGDSLPNLLLDSCKTGVIAGDWNCIDNVKDATHLASSKVSSVLQRLGRVMQWRDLFRGLHPSKKSFSHVYRRNMGDQGLTEGAARLDRIYAWGDLTCSKAEYFPAAFSDHMGLSVAVSLPALSPVVEPKFRTYFKINPEVATDQRFQALVSESVQNWLPAKEMMPFLEWWDCLKAEVKAAAKTVTSDRRNERKQELAYLMTLQAHLAAKVSGGDLHSFADLKHTQERITSWFSIRAKEVILHANIKEADDSEQTLIYHHEKLQKSRKRSAILKLQNHEGKLVEGHQNCASLLQGEARALLDNTSSLDINAQEDLLEFVEEVFTEADNNMLDKDISDEDVKASLLCANRHSSPGSDGISYLTYLACWNSLGHHLSDVIRLIVKEGKLPESMKNCFLVFSPKMNKESSTKIKDKRKLSLLQTDFKVLSGILAGRLKRTENHTISRHQYAAASKRVSQAVCLTRDAIECVKPSQKVAVFETDYVAAFDLMSVDWVLKVLLKKGCSERFVQVLRNIFRDEDSFVSCVINNEVQQRILNRRKNIKQGCRSSTQMYSYASDPLLLKLNKVLKGFTYFRHPTSGPHHPLFGKPKPIEEKLTVLGFVDDVKGLLTSVEEFHILDSTLASFEAASGSRLHRSTDPNNQKCSILPLGKWSRWSQSDSPLDFMKVVDNINLLGVKLARTTGKTRELTGSDLVASVQAKLNHFKAGRHSALVLKPHLANVYLLSKISHKAAAVHLRCSDVKKLQSAIRSWVTQELLKKPQEALLHRSTCEGGLGLVNVQARALANLTRSFLQSVHTSSYMMAIYKAFVREDDEAKHLVKKPSFFPDSLYVLIKEAFSDLRGQIFTMSTNQWQRRFTESRITHVRDPTTGSFSLLPSATEELWPTADWIQSWQNLRCKGLSPEQKSTLFKLCNDLIPHGVLLQKFKLASSAVCQHCNEVDGPLHFPTCSQANNLGSFTQEILSPLFFTQGDFSWGKVGTLDLSSASQVERLAGLVLLSETVNHITVTRKNAQKASPVKLAAILSHRAEVTAKSFPGAGTILATWAGDLRTRSESPSQGVPRPLPLVEQDGDSLQVISLVCGHPPPLYSTSIFTH